MYTASKPHEKGGKSGYRGSFSPTQTLSRLAPRRVMSSGDTRRNAASTPLPLPPSGPFGSLRQVWNLGGGSGQARMRLRQAQKVPLVADASPAGVRRAKSVRGLPTTAILSDSLVDNRITTRPSKLLPAPDSVEPPNSVLRGSTRCGRSQEPYWPPCSPAMQVCTRPNALNACAGGCRKARGVAGEFRGGEAGATRQRCLAAMDHATFCQRAAR
ncbi:hypothetical protein S40285_10056 [Stachybotrys chlorohalonatus IBT 40285]|uniref:Uncharacterized protein n=1 Tax=Stachybotrys chlorohalonatus (strain IBT 40285) TaxID=1283841 RepID=A0A084QT44_STAC4|nr:hypothetical protein S40285_10056 [Stachybotrys chlorohalonata IBT 40285]